MNKTTLNFRQVHLDFHSFKNQAALEFECFSMLALGAKKVSIFWGDKCHTMLRNLYDSIKKKLEAKYVQCGSNFYRGAYCFDDWI